MIPPQFLKVMKDFIADLFLTFPELKSNEDLSKIHESDDMDSYQRVFDVALTTLPLCTMDILQEKETLFTESRVFLPNVDFKLLWNETITEKTKTIIWKYLKLTLMSILGTIEDGDVQEKMKEAMDDMKNMFDKDINPDEMQETLQGMMNGKLGSLAKEIAEETIGNVKEEETIQNLMKDPSKLFGLVHTVGDKIEKKIKSGELKESELIEEATEMFAKMKDMPGLKQFEALFKGKMNMGAMQTKMDQNLKKAKMKERLQKKLAERTIPVQTEPAQEKVEKKKKNKNKKNNHDVLDS
jgi:hypothetical protein